MQSLDACLGGTREGQEHELPLSRRASNAAVQEAGSYFSADGKGLLNNFLPFRSQQLRLRYSLDIATVLSRILATEGFEELIKHFANDYICQALLSVCREHT